MLNIISINWETRNQVYWKFYIKFYWFELFLFVSKRDMYKLVPCRPCSVSRSCFRGVSLVWFGRMVMAITKSHILRPWNKSETYRWEGQRVIHLRYLIFLVRLQWELKGNQHCCYYWTQTDICKIQTQFRPKKSWNSDQKNPEIQTNFDHFFKKFRPIRDSPKWFCYKVQLR